MNKVSYILAAIAALYVMGSCREKTISEVVPGPSTAGFTINATYDGQKAAFDQDGLNMSWTPGDVLYLIDPHWENPTVALTTDITKAAKTARFHTDALIAPGQYIVVYGQDNLRVSREAQDLAIRTSVSDLNGQIRLYGNLEVSLGQTDADVSLCQLYAMLSFRFLNIPDGFPTLGFGMAVNTEGLQDLSGGTIGADGLSTGFSGDFMTRLGIVDGQEGHVFIAPVDLRNKKVIFYAQGNDGSGRKVYEFIKDGRELLAGKDYAITIDFASPTKYVAFSKTESGASIINNADDFLAAALMDSGNSFELMADIDFSGEIFLPAYVGSLRGNGHTLSHIQCGLPQCSNVGVVSEGGVHDLNVTDSIFEGMNNVGAIAGKGYCTGCNCTGVRVIGEDYVGGFVGRGMSGKISGCVAKGGIVNAIGEYVGGIAGCASYGAEQCGFEGSVLGSDSSNYVGGVTGEGNCSQCYCVGSVSGIDYVGGVSGCSGCCDCYFIGSITSHFNCFGGISGADGETEVARCYSCISDSPFSFNIGICAKTTPGNETTNLTSLAKLYYELGYSENCDCGPGYTFLSNISAINGNGAYLPLCWPDNDALCPILAWQYTGLGGNVTIPEFEQVVW